MSLGAFLAGVLLADSEYRHELEANIEPFKGLLLGLFFISVGMSADLGQVLERPLLVLAAVVGLMGVKAAILYALGRLSGHSPELVARAGRGPVPGRRVRLRAVRAGREQPRHGARRGRPAGRGGDPVDGGNAAGAGCQRSHRPQAAQSRAGPALRCDRRRGRAAGDHRRLRARRPDRRPHPARARHPDHGARQRPRAGRIGAAVRQQGVLRGRIPPGAAAGRGRDRRPRSSCWRWTMSRSRC